MSDMVIVVQGGNVVAVYAQNPSLDVIVVDLDIGYDPDLDPAFRAMVEPFDEMNDHVIKELQILERTNT